jgi:hypothetical protein
MVNYVVSGCPRSGTSMLMQILTNAGMPIATDKKREADKDNMKGYYEVDGIVDKVKENPNVVVEYDNKVLKIIHFGIQYLPKLPKGKYKLIYIERDIEEVLDSMDKMVGEKDNKRDETKEVFLKFNKLAKKLIQEREDIDFILVNHRDLLTNPEPTIDKIIEFFNIDKDKKQAMISVIDQKSYRNRR